MSPILRAVTTPRSVGRFTSACFAAAFLGSYVSRRISTGQMPYYTCSIICVSPRAIEQQCSVLVVVMPLQSVLRSRMNRK